MSIQWKAGDMGANSCRRCRKIVRTRFEYRTLQPQRSRVRIPDVLVDVCTECDHMISVPRQSVAQLRELGAGK
jgi:hypothetical protein